MPEPDEHEEPEASPYLRRTRRVEIRRRSARWRRFSILGGVLLVLSAGVLSAAVYSFTSYLTASPRYALVTSPKIEGLDHVSRDQIFQIFSADYGRSIYEVPLEKRRRQVMTIPWVESAYVSRSWPNRLRVVITERKPIAFARAAATRSRPLALIDRDGVVMPLPRRAKFSLPVLAGVDESQPLAERKKRVELMQAVLEDLDRDTPRRSGEVGEIDLTDPTDAVISVTEAGTAVVVHLGSSAFLDRYKFFLQNVETWRDQYGSVRSVDLRFENQVVVKP